MKLIMKQYPLLKRAIISCVLFYLFPVYSLAIGPTIEERITIFNGSNKENYVYDFEICFDSLDKIGENNYNHILEVVLFAKYFNPIVFHQKTQIIPEHYSYYKEKHKFIYSNTKVNNTCNNLQGKYKIYIHNFSGDIRKISVKGVDTNHRLPKSLEFNSFTNNEDLICIATFNENEFLEIWSQKTCFDKNGFAYFSSQENINCIDLIKVFDKAPIFNKKKILQKITMKENEELLFSIPEDTFTDEEGDTLTYNAISLPDWLNFAPSIKTFRGTPKNDDVGIHKITVTASDEHNTSSGSFVITVINDNTPPVYVGKKLSDLSVNEDELWRWVFPVHYFIDKDGDTLSYKATVKDQPILSTWLKFDLTTLTFSGQPRNEDVGEYTISLSATDGKGEATTSFDLIVNNVNDAPTIKKRIVDISYRAGIRFDFDIPDYFTDIDKGDILTYKAQLSDGTGLPHWIHFSEKSGRFHGTIPSAHPQKAYKICVRANDGKVDSKCNTFFFLVKPFLIVDKPIEIKEDNKLVNSKINDPKITAKIPLLVFEQDKTKTYEISKTLFSDNKNAFTYKLNTQNERKDLSWLRLENFKDKLVFIGQPTRNHFGPYLVKLEVVSQITTLTTHIQIKVKRNTPPKLSIPLLDQNAQINRKFQYRFHNKTFIDDGPLFYRATLSNGDSLPDWLYFDGGQRIFGGIPTKSGMYKIKVTASNPSDKIISDTFIIKVQPEHEPINIKPELAKTCFDDYRRIIFSPIDQHNNITTPQIATLISSHNNVYKTQISCDTIKCFFCAPPDISSHTCYIWSNSGEYLGILSKQKSLLNENETILFVKKPEKCAYINQTDHHLNIFEKHLKEIHNVISNNSYQAGGNIRQLINIDKFEIFYNAWTNQRKQIIPCQCEQSCSLIYLDDDRSYFQRFNNYWSFKTLDYSKGPILIPVPITTKLDSSINISQKKNDNIGNNEYAIDISSQIIFDEPSENKFEEYQYSPSFGMVHLNKQFRIPNNFDVHSFYITSIDSMNKTVCSPVFCENNRCKYYSPPSVRFTFVWQKKYKGYQFMSSLPSKHIQRYSLINGSNRNIKYNNIIQSLYNSMQQSQIANVCINQEENKRICINDFLPQNVNLSNTCNLSTGTLCFKCDARGNYIIFNNSSYCFQKNQDRWSYKSLPHLITINSDIFSFRKDVKPKVKKVATPCFWDNNITYYETPVYNSNEKHYRIKDSNKFLIGYKNFIQEKFHCSEKKFSKWIIVDEFEDTESYLMLNIFRDFRKNEFKKLIKQLATESAYRLDGINRRSITRIHTLDPDFAIRTISEFVPALATIEPHKKTEQHLKWELHVFVPRITSIDSFHVSEMALSNIKERLKRLNVKRFCIWEFSYSKPREETAYKKLVDALQNNSFQTRYKIIYDKDQFLEIAKLITKK